MNRMHPIASAEADSVLARETPAETARRAKEAAEAEERMREVAVHLVGDPVFAEWFGRMYEQLGCHEFTGVQSEFRQGVRATMNYLMNALASAPEAPAMFAALAAAHWKRKTTDRKGE